MRSPNEQLECRISHKFLCLSFRTCTPIVAILGRFTKLAFATYFPSLQGSGNLLELPLTQLTLEHVVPHMLESGPHTYTAAYSPACSMHLAGVFHFTFLFSLWGQQAFKLSMLVIHVAQSFRNWGVLLYQLGSSWLKHFVCAFS